MLAAICDIETELLIKEFQRILGHRLFVGASERMVVRPVKQLFGEMPPILLGNAHQVGYSQQCEASVKKFLDSRLCDIGSSFQLCLARRYRG